MATRGFEFAYMLDGSNATPVIRDWKMVADAAGYKAGDLLVIDSNGRADKAAATAGEVLGVCQETETDAVSNDDLLKMAIITRNQVWRCSTDATSHALKDGYTKTLDIVDENTMDADGSSGNAILVDDDTDDEGNVIFYVVFSDTTFGNA